MYICMHINDNLTKLSGFKSLQHLLLFLPAIYRYDAFPLLPNT